MSTEVIIRECPCPGTPHPEGDVVFLKEEPDVAMFVAFGVTFENVKGSALSIAEWEADMRGALGGVYLRHGIRAWTFEDAKGDGIRVEPAAIARLLPFLKGGREVIEAADALYGKALMAPFVEASEARKKERLRRRTKKSSPATSTAGSTARTPRSGSKLRVVSKPSSPTDTDGRPSEVRAS